MARAIKFKNNDYLDSTGIVHNQGLLSTLLENMKVKNLYRGRTNGNITLSDNVMNYDFIEIIYAGNSNYLQNAVSILDTRYIQTTAIELIANELNSEGQIVIRQSKYNIIGNTMTYLSCRYNIISTSGMISNTNGPYIYILAVNGYKLV